LDLVLLNYLQKKRKHLKYIERKEKKRKEKKYIRKKEVQFSKEKINYHCNNKHQNLEMELEPAVDNLMSMVHDKGNNDEVSN